MVGDKEIVYEYLKQNAYMSLATASADAVPEVATVEYLVDGDSLLINTVVQYRKYGNLVTNPKVAGVVTTGHEKTLQFNATVVELADVEAEQAKQKLLAFDPSFKDFFSEENTRFFRISPTWLRLRDYTQQPMKVIELNI